MSEGVGVDMGTPGAAPVDQHGTPLPPRVRLVLELDRAGAVKTAKGFSAMGMQDVSDHISQAVGNTPVKANIIERNPIVSGTLLGFAIVGAGYGVYRTVRYFRNRSAMPAVTASGKVIPMSRAARG